jgi:hypothetical protein
LKPPASVCYTAARVQKRDRSFVGGNFSVGRCVAFTQNPNQPAKLTSVKVKDDLYVIHNDFVPGNTTTLITNEGVLLVDDKFEVDHSNIIRR